MYLVRTFLFGVASYAVVGLIYVRTGRHFDLLNMSDRQWSFTASLDELGWALVASFLLSLAWIAGRTHKVVTRMLNYLGISNHVADQDIWEFMFNSDTPKTKFAHIRDYPNELVYAGYVKAYSETPDVRELAMYDVIVYDDKGTELYPVPYLYLSRGPSNITLEFPVAETNDDKARKWRLKRWWQSSKRWIKASRDRPEEQPE